MTSMTNHSGNAGSTRFMSEFGLKVRKERRSHTLEPGVIASGRSQRFD